MTVGILIGWLMSSVRMQARVAGQRERRTALLYAMARELAATRGSENIARVAVRHVGESFEAQAVVLLPDGQRKIRHPSGSAEPASLRSADLSVAQWVFEHGRPAGIGTDTLPGTAARYLPLTASDTQLGQLGVLAVLPANTRRIMLPEQAHLLETFAVQIALALERAALAERAQSAAVNAEAESVRSSLLAAISHDMRTPLAVIRPGGNRPRRARAQYL
jgi:two-component system sensor histidine kinase KdpD